MSTAALLEDSLGAACDSVARPQGPSAHACIEVDLSAVTFFGTTGLTVLVTALGRYQALDIPPRLIAAGPAVVRQLRAVGLAEVFLSTPPDAPGYAA